MLGNIDVGLFRVDKDIGMFIRFINWCDGFYIFCNDWFLILYFFIFDGDMGVENIFFMLRILRVLKRVSVREVIRNSTDCGKVENICFD